MENKKKISVLVISVSSPILVGLYQENILFDTIVTSGKTSDQLPLIFANLLKKYSINKLYYVNGPGSYMAIKISYMFLKTFSIVQKIPLEATHGFHFNHNSPIKALGKKYFFNPQDDKIIVDFLDEKSELRDFELPLRLEESIFNKESLPNYHLPAV